MEEKAMKEVVIGQHKRSQKTWQGFALSTPHHSLLGKVFKSLLEPMQRIMYGSYIVQYHDVLSRQSINHLH